ncbi:MFS transporter [Rhodovulum sp. ES.010]|uniref:MFS transporter n=1 Tax=Rhodovulum sp. ES.010 TaxID=1882821 RepID=UPI000940A45C
MGYFGGIACLGLVFFAVLDGRPGGEATAMPLVGPIVAARLVVFSLRLLVLTPDRPRSGLGLRRAAREGLGRLRAMLTDLRHHANFVRFPVAQLVYTDGTGTLFAFGGVYAAGTFGMAVHQALLFGVPILLVGGAASFWAFAVAVGFYLGPVQPASRSLLAPVAPPAVETQMFGFFATSARSPCSPVPRWWPGSPR